MIIESLRTYNFRNLSDSTIDTSNKHVLLVGDNGQGKSNFIEAIYFACYGSSFRTRLQKQITRFSKNDLSVIASIKNGDNTYKIKVIFKDGKRKTYINDNEIKDRKELLSICTCIVFSHEDMEYVNGSPMMQRKFFDQTISLLNNPYIDSMRLYNAVIKQRNALLKNGDESLIGIYNKKLADIGLEIQRQRTWITEKCNEIFPTLYEKISENPLPVTIIYNPSWKATNCSEDIIRILENSYNRDKKYEMTTSGPHRDKFMFIQDERDFISTASTGQIRLTAIVMKLVQSVLYGNLMKNRPILLLDDVLLELDISKRERFLENIYDYDQAFFTFLPKESYFKEKNTDNITFKVSDGVLESI